MRYDKLSRWIVNIKKNIGPVYEFGYNEHPAVRVQLY